MPIGLYYEYKPYSCDEMVSIKYGKEGGWGHVSEEFPIQVPEISGCNCWSDIQDKLELWGLGVDAPISTLQTSGDFLDGDEVFMVYSKDDIRQLICKLNEVLCGMGDEL